MFNQERKKKKLKKNKNRDTNKINLRKKRQQQQQWKQTVSIVNLHLWGKVFIYSYIYFVFNIYFLNLPMHVLPSPVNPGIHEHWNDPSTLVHMLFGEQLWDCDVHSSISMNGKRKNKTKKKQTTKNLGSEINYECLVSFCRLRCV